MSWIDDIEHKSLKITTGDGEIYFPKWKEAAKSRDYNISIFDFMNIEGSLVRRAKPKALTMTLILYFDGEDCVDRSNNFEISARDSRRWTIDHPFYGSLYVHPISLAVDNTELNLSKITVPVIETLIETYPQGTVYAPGTIQLKQLQNFTYCSDFCSYDMLDGTDDADVTTKLQDFLFNYNSVMASAWSVTTDALPYKNYFRVALNTLDNIASTPLQIIRAIQSLINFPATATQTVQARFNIYKEALQNVINSIVGINPGARTLSDKNNFELLGSMIIASMMYSAGLGTYQNLADVFLMQSRLGDVYSSYVNTVESSLTADAGAENSYVPNYDIAQSLDDLYNYTIVALLIIGLITQQKRSIILEKDSNLILLTHRFYGLDNADVNIQKFMSDNNICINEIFNIKKGREIIYYVG